jgi:hypothetical protein
MAFLYRFEQRSLDARSSAVGLIDEEDVGKEGPLSEDKRFCGPLINCHTREIDGKQIRSALNSPVRAAN